MSLRVTGTTTPQLPATNAVVPKPSQARLPSRFEVGRRIRNWNGSIEFNPGRVARPTTEAELIDAIRSSERVRAMGAGHSFNGSFVANERATLLDMKGLKRIESVQVESPGKATVWVEAGVTIAELTETLAARGWAVRTLPTSEKITVGGAMANGVHGGGLKAPAVFAEYVVGMENITADSEKVSVPQSLLPLARVGMGSLGTTYRAKLECVPEFELVSADDFVSARQAFDITDVRKNGELHDHAIYYYQPQLDDGRSPSVVRRFNDRVTPENAHRKAGARQKTSYTTPGEALWQRPLSLGVSLLGTIPRWLDVFSLRELLGKGFSNGEVFSPRPTTYGASRFMFHEATGGLPGRDVSLGIPLESIGPAMAAVREAFRRIGYVPHLPLGIRFLRKTDDIALALNSGRDTAVVELFTLVGLDDAKEAQARRVFEDVLRSFQGRAHWAKEFRLDPRPTYPAEAWREFADLRARWGKDKFTNAWSETFVPRQTGKSVDTFSRT